MKKTIAVFSLVVVCFLLAGYLVPSAPAMTLYQRLNSLDGVEVIGVKAVNGATQGYRLLVEQPLDHDNPGAGSYKQRVYLSHLDENQPVVVETHGYRVKDFSRLELSHILRANQVVIEYRFYGESKNQGDIPWQYLTAGQAADDHHRVIQSLKEIYSSPWISTGYSKGGVAAMIHRRQYPDDVVCTIAYDAPLIFGTKDPRTDAFIKRKGREAKACGKELVRFQRELLERRNELMPALAALAEEKKMDFSIGLDTALEYAALEYTFSFWQRGQKCADIPPVGAKPEQMLAHIQKGGGFWVYSDKGIEALEPSFYQHLTQFGYYGFITENLKDLLRVVPEPDNRFFAPDNVEMVFDETYIPGLLAWLQEHGHNIIYLYGENDTWSAAAVDHGDQTNAFTLIQKEGYHATQVKDLDDGQQRRFYRALHEWVGVPLNKY